jgi:ribosomal protein S18 acetylase RimI-like enzyme
MAEVTRQVRRLTESDWAALRATRLAALAEAPYAFASTLEREQGFTEQTWRERLGPDALAVYFGADVGDGADAGAGAGGNGAEPSPLAGLAALLGPSAATGLDGWHLVSMWVNPATRGQGLADRLIAAVCDLAREQGAVELELWVTLGNDRARAFYQRNGFNGTADRQLIRPEDPDSWEERMVRPLG